MAKLRCHKGKWVIVGYYMNGSIFKRIKRTGVKRKKLKYT